MSLADQFTSPDLFLHRFEGADAVFAAMDRAAYHRTIFCDARLQPKGPQSYAAPIAALAGKDFGPPPFFIFHMAHCGSTLLARALDTPADLVIREPMALRQLGVERAASFDAPPPADWRLRLKLAASLLGRRYQSDHPVIVKANVPVNTMLPELMALAPEAPAIALYFPFVHYLTAILRSPNHRGWIAHVSRELEPALAGVTGTEAPHAEAAQAARLWLMQILLYEAALARHPGVKSLNAEFLFNEPREALAAGFGHFGIPARGNEIEAIVSSDLFTRNAKKPNLAFDNAQRLARRDALKDQLGFEIDAAREWLKRTGKAIPTRLARPLAGDSAELLMHI